MISSAKPEMSYGGPELSTQPPRRFDWPLAQEAEDFLRSRIDSFLERNRTARDLAKRMLEETGADVFEWVDHLVLSAAEEPALRRAGLIRDDEAEAPEGCSVYEHPRATLPRVLVGGTSQPSPSLLALRPESLPDFISRQHLFGEPEGEPFSRFRRVTVAEENGTKLEAGEGRAYRGFRWRA